ncbi:hypothetical protein [Streptomyces sp. AC495_CC817]|uniref:hypothetical protein n=1 Tax=Streptomyces sp. AC495_CC817 TaxID=2823900 RepID=UPI001C261DBD|nr:hypothetical protein [Streptomyces sp. AC495_CC817]
MNPLDTVMWLVNFPAAHGYAMVFIAGFSLLGLFAMSASSSTPDGALRVVRQREGLLREDAPQRGRLAGRLTRIVFRVLAFAMLANLVIGILSLTGVPITRAYIHENGTQAPATVDGNWVTFAVDGVEYTLESNFFTPAVYPDRDVYIPSGEPVVVRYLPGHPQAFVIDSAGGPR